MEYFDINPPQHLIVLEFDNRLFFLLLVLQMAKLPKKYQLIATSYADLGFDGPVIISFWATWCLPCIKEIDKLNEFIHDYENVSVILINEDRPGDKAKVKSFVRSRQYPIDDNYHIIFDFDKKLSRQFSAEPIPLTLILKGTKVIYRKRGFYLGDEVELKKQLRIALSD